VHAEVGPTVRAQDVDGGLIDRRRLARQRDREVAQRTNARLEVGAGVVELGRVD
jgi:hypothetical protein